MAKNKTLEAARKAYNKSTATKYRNTGNKKTKKKEQKVKSHYGGVSKKAQDTVENRAEARAKTGSVAKSVGSNVVRKKTTNTSVSTGDNKQNGRRSGAITPVSSKQKERQVGASTARSTAKSVGKTVTKATNLHKAKTEVTDVTQGTARGTAAGSAFNKGKAAEKALEKAGEKKTLTVKKDQLTAEQKAAQERAARQTRFYTNSLVASGRITQKEADDAVEKAKKNASKGVKEDHTLTYSNSAQSNEKVQRVANAAKFTNVEVEDKKAKEKAIREARFYTNSQVAAGNMSQKEADKIVKEAGKGHRTTQSANILDKLGGEGEAERQGTRQAGQMNDSKFASGVMQGMSYGDNTRAVGKYNQQAAELVDTVKQSGAFNAGYMTGQGLQFMLGGTNKMTDALVKGVAKSGAARSALNIGLRKGGADMLFESPINTLDAIKMSTDANGNFDATSFKKYMLLNSGLSGGIGSAIGGIGAKMTKMEARSYLELSAKAQRGLATESELERLGRIQTKFDNIRQGNDVAKTDIVDRADYDARVHKEVFSKSGNANDAIDAMNGAATHSEKMNYAATIKENADTQFEILKAEREILVRDLKNASPEDAVEIRKQLADNQQELNRLGSIANVAERELKISEKRNRRAVQNLAETAGKMKEATGVNYRVVNDKDMRKIIAEQGEDASEDYFYKGFYYKNKNGETEILINSESPQAHQTVIGHETGHLIKSSNEQEFFKLGADLEAYAKKMGDWDAVYNQLKRSYPEASKKELREEITCELLGRYVYGKNDEFIKQLAGEQPSVLKKIVDYLKKLVSGTSDSEMAKELQAIIDKTDSLVKAINKDEVAKNAKAVEGKASKEKPDAGSFNEEIKSLDPDYAKSIGTGAKFSKVAKPETLKFLDDQEKAGKTVEVYRAMVEIDGKLYPPMATKIKSGSGKAELQNPNKLGEWEQADEHPELVKNFDEEKGYGKFTLRKDNGTTVDAAYNPYIHTSFSPLNDQFSSAYNRPNLVVVKGVVPESELTSGYKATYAKDAVGKTQWHSGVVAGQLPEAREVMLTRWFKPQEVVSDAEVAKTIKQTLGDTGIEIPYNVVTPSLRRELEKIGVPIGEGRGGAPKEIPSLESGKASKENVGYHAGDLGKAESMGNQTGGRGTGHFGTGTYFVGNKVKIDGYNARDGKPAPVETVNFDKYNLYKPHNTEDAYALHDFLRDVNDYFELVDSPKTERNFVRNIKRRTDDLDYKLWDAQDELESLNKSVKSMDDDSLLAAEVAEQRVYELRKELYELGKDALGESRVGKLIGEEDPKQLSEKSANEILWDLQHPDDNGWYNNWERPLNKVSSFYDGLDLWAIRLNTSKDKLLDAMREAKRQSDSLPLGSDKRYTADSASTLLMKKLGYEGVDVRHTDLDNTTYGSVIYDLKGEDLARKKEIGTARFSKEARGKRDTSLDAEIKTLLKDEHLKSGAGKGFETDLRAVAKLVEEEKIDDAVTKVQEVVRKHMTVDEFEAVDNAIDENVKSIIKSSPINIGGLGDGTIAHKLENIGYSKADVPSAIQLRSAKGGRPLDRVYTELSDERPDIFPPDASSEDKLKHIIDAMTREPDRARKPQDWIDGEYNDLAVSVLEKVADGVYADRKLATPKPEPKPEPKVEKPAKPKKKPAKEPEKTEVQKLHENEYVSDNVKTALKDIEEAGVNVGKAEKVAKRFNNLDKQIGAKTKHIENAKKSEKYATEAERAERVAELNDELATLKQKQAKAAGELEQLGKMKAVDPNKTAEQQIKEMRGERKVNKELKNTENLTKTDNWIKDKWNSVRRLWEDSLIDVENTAKATGDMNLRNEILTAANRVRNSMSEANTWITKHRRSFDNKVGGKALDEIFNKELINNEPKYADFQEYLIMKHVPARHAKGTDIYPEISPELAAKRVKELEEKYGDEIKKWSQDVYDYINDLQQYRVDSGMLSQEAADQFAKDYPFYVPTNRVNEDEAIDFFTGGLSNQIRTAKGGENDVLDMYSQLYTATNKTIHAAEENEMLNLYFRAKGVTPEQIKGAELPDLEHAVIEANVNKKTGDASVSFFIDGKPVKFPCSHQLALGLRELDGLEFERLMNAAKVSTLYGKPFKALITDWNLVFGVRNGMRDMQQAVVNSKDTRYFGSSFGAAGHAIAHEDSPYRKLYASMGGERAQLVSYDAVAKNLGIEKQGKIDALHEKAQDWVDAEIKGVHTNPIHYIEGINGAIEMMPRMCEFIGTLRKEANSVLKKQGSSLKKLRKEIIDEVNAIEKEGKIGQSEIPAEVENRLANRIIDMVDKDTIDSAMRNANDITLNFGRSGVLGKALNMGFVPYLNPSIQGLSKLVRLFTEAGGEGGWKALASIGMKLGTFTIAPAVWNELALRNNEEYQNLNTRDKDNNFFIALGDGKFIKIPKPRENAVLAEPVEYGLRYFLDKSEYAFFDWDKLKTEDVPLWDKIPLTDEGKQSLRTAVDNIGVINPMTSNMVSPLWQTFHNKTWYGGSIESAYETAINEDTGKANVPVNKRYDTGTSGVAIWLGQSKVAKELNLSPKKIDNILDSYTGMIYDLGISQTTEEAKTRGNYLLRTAASQFLKDSVFSNKLSTKAWEKIDGMSKKEQDEYKSKYMYDAYKYDDAMDAITADKNMTVKEKMEAKRFLQKQRNKLYRAAINGEENTTNPLKDISKYLGANKTLNKFLPKSGDEQYDNWTDYYKNYKKTKGYKNLTPAQKEKEAQKFLDVYTLGVKGQSKISGDFHDAPSWGMTGVAAAQRYKQGKLSQKDAETIMQSCGVYESQTASYFKYADHGGNVSRYAVTKKNNNNAEDLANELGVSTKGDGSIWKNKYSKEKGIKGGVYSMSLATGKADFKDRAYYISNSGDSNMLIKMNAARGYAEKYGHTTKQLIKLGKKADADGNTYLSNEEIESACQTIKKGKATSEEKAMAWVLLGGNPNKNPFGAIGNYSHDGDTGITMDDDGKSGGGGGRRGRGRRGRGGGGGGSKKGTMPKTESGAIKGKVTDVFATSNGSKSSNLNDAYRKKVRKLRKELR